MGRAPCCEKVGLRRGRWTAEEDEKLASYIGAHGEGSWRSLPKNAGLLRCGKSCRLRWINYLRADLKRGDITREEEEVIINLHSTLGNRWSLIATHLPGRTDNEIKNYWNSHLSRRLHCFRKVGGEGEIVTLVLDKLPNASTRRGGRTSRRSMKKNQENKNTVHDHPNNTTLLVPSDDLDRVLSRCADGTPGQDSDTTAGPSGLRQVAEGGPPAMNGSGTQENVTLDWDLDDKSWDDAGEMWRWFWDGEDDKGDLLVHGMDGCDEIQQNQIESFDCWLMSLENLLD